MKALIVDDERLARLHLGCMLHHHPWIKIVGQAHNAQEARKRCLADNPDLLFLDIQMPGENGIDMLQSLPRIPQVIFTTAHEGFALKAFEFNTIDYLLKPIDPQRLAQALDKVKRPYKVSDPEQNSGELGLESRVFVKDGLRCWLVDLKKVRLFESEGNHTRLYFENEKPLIHRSLQYLEMRLDHRHFFRANRKHILNLKWVDTLSPSGCGGIKAKLTCGKSIEISRRQAQRFKLSTSL